MTPEGHAVPAPQGADATNTNGHNNQLTKSQLAAVAAEMIHSGPPAKRGEGSRVHLLGRKLGVGATIIRTALSVLRTQPELFERVKAGELPLSVVAPQAGWKPRQPRPAQDTPSQPQHVPGELNRHERAAVNRMVTGLSQIRGLCRGIASLDPAVLVRCLSAEDRLAWKQTARRSARVLHALASRLGEGVTS